MNSLVFAGCILMIAAVAKADAPNRCPNLTGTYSCKTEKGPSALTVTQEIVNNQTIYTTIENGDETQSPTDNFEYPINDIENNVTGSARFVCENASFVSYMNEQKSDGKKNVLVSWNVKQALSLNTHGDLQISVQTQMTIKGQSVPENGTNICKRVAQNP